MDEYEWLASGDPNQMFKYLSKTDCFSRRKISLFFLACGRCHASRLPLPFTPSYFDEEEARLDNLDEIPIWPTGQEDSRPVLGAGSDESFREAKLLGRFYAHVVFSDPKDLPGQANLLRDIFGSLPFRSPKFEPAWRTQRSVELAKSIYEQRSFERLPLLADILEENGCNGNDILTHCRQPGPHVRGCWVLDLILEKK